MPGSHTAGEIFYAWCHPARSQPAPRKNLTITLYNPAGNPYWDLRIYDAVVNSYSVAPTASLATKQTRAMATRGATLSSAILPKAFLPRSEGGMGIESITLTCERILWVRR